MDYKLMEPPFAMKEFKEMNKKEAQNYFDWFISQIPERIEILSNAYLNETNERDVLDRSPESLKAVWQWFIPQISHEPKTKEEIAEEIKTTPEFLRERIQLEKLTTKTMALAMDIGIYFGEVFNTNFPQINWGVVMKPKNFISVNRPVLLGFKNKMNLDTSMLLSTSVSIVVDGDKDPNALFNLYNVWKGYMFKES